MVWPRKNYTIYIQKTYTESPHARAGLMPHNFLIRYFKTFLELLSVLMSGYLVYFVELAGMANLNCSYAKLFLDRDSAGVRWVLGSKYTWCIYNI
jgi:hypothetical protein